MFKGLTIKSFIALFIVLFGLQSAFSQAAFWSENFDDQASATTNWVSGGSNAGATPQTWTWTNDLGAGFQTPNNDVPAFGSPTGAGGYFFFNSDGNGAGVHAVTLTGAGKPASCTGMKDVHLRFFTQYAHFNTTAKAEIGISTDGVNFTYQNAFPVAIPANVIVEDMVDVDLNGANNQAQVWIQFRWTGDFEYHWKIDDIELYDVPVVKTNVTFQVNLSQVANPDPAGAKIAGSFTGWADADMTDAGNGVWTYTTALDAGTEILWKYKNGPNGWENVTAACGKSDGFGGFNRVYTVPAADATLAAVCLNSCDPCVTTCDQNPNAIICDNIDSYATNLKLGPQAPWWTTWSGTEGTTEDGIVTTEQAASAPNSFKLHSTATNGGPQDVVLNLGNRTSGNYELKWKMYVPAGKNGYYNIQNVVPIGAGDWNLDVFFNNNGEGALQIGATAIPGDFTYPYAQWFEVKHQIDLDNNLLTLWIDGKFVKKMAYAKNLGGIDFYCTNNVSTYYVDDVEYISLPPVTYNVDVCDAAIDLTTYFGGAPGVAQTTGLQNNTGMTVGATDPAASSLCFLDLENGQTPAPKLDGTMWYTFLGDGNRYHIETVPCNATNYIGGADDPGDTQMAVFSGTDCTALTLEVCNDDLSATGTPDWRAGVDIETAAGENYYMMLDGFNFDNVVATGEFCIEITLAPAVDCNTGAAGTFTVGTNNNGIVCFEENLNVVTTVNNASFVIPTVGPVYGMAWCISAQPVPANAWPGSIAGIASTVFNPDVILVNLPNDGANFPAGVYYLTPVVVGGGELIDPAGLARVFNVDPTNGCYFVGESKPILLMPDPSEFEPIAGFIAQSFGAGGTTLNLTPAGGLAEYVGDPSLYLYQWSNGATTQDITVTGGSYTVTISDPTGCPDISPAVVTVTGAKDPESVKNLTLSPNPARETILLQLSLEKTADVRGEIVNSIGQVVNTISFGKVATLNQAIDLAGYADGVYFIRLSVDGEKTQRSFVVSH